jgi:hypothetical protein
MMEETQIKHMVTRFLQWKLPADFHPDAGITFKAAFNEHTTHAMKHEPRGTNLLDAVQAEAMVRDMTNGMSLTSVAASETEAAEYRSCLYLAQYFLAGKKTHDTDSETDLADTIQGAIERWFSEQDNAAEASWVERQEALVASGGPDDSISRRDMVAAGRGHLIR